MLNLFSNHSQFTREEWKQAQSLYNLGYLSSNEYMRMVWFDRYIDSIKQWKKYHKNRKHKSLYPIRFYDKIKESNTNE